ncbi:hypothetical protein BJ973_001275 [Actinoplanes tereljensis]|uniref:F5/8 type C domain-containing protein n=1 Tax=Paractinoplanes tereljensis TaxID=571912 RepID=A0A919NMT1_9ACTN|nr:discoidin domain-containing protein [Actinoplanes tereljensis]GIF20819.1 hypothetical protein Ate02nite_35490 [Actinoplanes tereljensis]
MTGTPSDHPDPADVPAQRPSSDEGRPSASEKAATERAAALRAVFAASPRPGQSTRDLRGFRTSGSPATGRPTGPGPATDQAATSRTPKRPSGLNAPGTPATGRRGGKNASGSPDIGWPASQNGAGSPAASGRRRRRLWLVPVVVGAVALGAVAGGIAVHRAKPTTIDGTAAADSSGQAGVQLPATGVTDAPTPSPSSPVASSVAPTSASALPSSPTATATSKPTPSSSPTVTGRANPSGTNLALNKTATASSIESAPWPASAAVDGDMASRWSSGFADPQWIKVDLGAVWAISDVRLAWEHAYALSYRVDLSLDGSKWSTVYRTTAGTDGVREIPVTKVPARYVRVYGLKRVSQYGYSLQELEVH